MLSRRGRLALVAYCQIALLRALIARSALAPGRHRRTKSCVGRAPFATSIHPRRRASISPKLFELGTAGNRPPGLRRAHGGDRLAEVVPVAKRLIASETFHQTRTAI
jgi:hypothetical protein